MTFFAPPGSDLAKLGVAAVPSAGQGVALDPNQVVPVQAGVASIVTNISEAPAPSRGSMVRVRAGATPFSFETLVWDETYNKWVGIERMIAQQDESFAGTSASYAVLSGTAGFTSGSVQNFKAFYDAGLRAQFRVAGRLTNSGANTTFLSADVIDMDNNSTVTNATLAAADANAASATGTGNTWANTSWLQPTITPTGAHAIFRLNYKVSAGTGTITFASLYFRWVSA